MESAEHTDNIVVLYTDLSLYHFVEERILHLAASLRIQMNKIKRKHKGVQVLLFFSRVLDGAFASTKVAAGSAPARQVRACDQRNRSQGTVNRRR